MKCGRGLATLVLPLLVAAVAGNARAQSLDELYALAKSEGQVNLYGGGPTALYTGWAKMFEERFPGIKVNITGGFSNRLAADIDAQRKAGKLEADVAILQTIQDFERWRKTGALLPFKPDGFDLIPASFKDVDGAYVGIGVNTVTYAYNPTLVNGAAIPRSARDLLDPRFRGKLISTYPHDDDITLYLYSILVDKHGWEFMDGLMKNAPVFVMGHLGVVQKIGKGESAATFDSITSLTLVEKKRGGAIEVLVPTDIPMPIWAQSAAVFKEAPHPNGAKLYVAWYLTKEIQHRMHRAGSWSPRTDVAPPDGFKPIAEYTVANNFRDFITNEAKVAELRRRFEAYIGPVKGEQYR
jgi:ABC-type Fe3+ transport system substrate-binding protein